MKLIDLADPTTTHDEPDSRDWSQEDISRFNSQDVDKDDNLPDLQHWVDNNEMEALVDEESGGIIGYINRAHMGKVLKRLNNWK